MPDSDPSPANHSLPAVAEVADLLSLLPSAQEHMQLLRNGEGISYVASADPRYVPPPLEVIESDAHPFVVLLSAPAAVGKTALAKYLAASTGNAYWDLGRFKVADNFLAGTIGRFFGFATTGEFLARLSSGTAALILDSLDEASVGTGNVANFQAFLEGTGELLAELAPPVPIAVMLARDETAFWVGEFLRDSGARVLHVRISYFDNARSWQFIDQTLEILAREAGDNVPRKYDDAVDVIFETLAQLLGASADPWGDRSRSFTGYAPVLAAIADYLFAISSRDADFAGAIRDLMTSTSLWRFLERIVVGVLEREQHKLLRAAREQLHLTFSDDVYTPEEQVAYLLAPRLDNVFVRTPRDLPRDDQASFIDAARAQLDDHPFLANRGPVPALRFVNPAFRDFALASALAGQNRRDLEAALMGTRLAEFQPSPLLAFFLLLRLAREDRGMSTDVFTAFYDSLVSRPEGLRLEVVDDPADSDTAIATVRLAGATYVPSVPGTPAELGHDVVTRIVVMGIKGAALQFRTRARNLVIDHPGAVVVLGDSRVGIKIGPAVDIDVDIVRVEAADVAIAAADAPVVIRCRVFDDRSRGVAPRVFSDESGIAVIAPRLTFPWDRFVPPVSDSRDGQALSDAYEDLWQMVRWFKGGVSGGLTYHQPTLDTLMRRGRVAKELADYARKTGLVTMKNGYYQLHPEVAHVTLQQVKQRALTPELMRYLRGYIAEVRARHRG